MPRPEEASGGGAEKPPVTPETAMRMASHYLARYAASTARLRQVLERRIRRRCELRQTPAPEPDDLRALIDGVVARLVAAGVIDDAAYGRGRAAALARKGWPAWRIRSDLARQDVDLDDAAQDLDDGRDDTTPDLDDVAQATRYAERKRLGPFRSSGRAAHRERDIARLARFGFPVSVARAVVDDAGDGPQDRV